MREAIALAETYAGRPLQSTYVDENRVGDHIWWIGSNAKFQSHYPAWRQRYDVLAGTPRGRKPRLAAELVMAYLRGR